MENLSPRSTTTDLDPSDLQSVHMETKNLTRKVGARTLVDRVSVVIEPGEILAVTGPSGAGKSSFLRLINRLDEPTDGLVLIDGQDYRGFKPPVLRREVGMVMQGANLFPGTVGSNLQFGPAQSGFPLDEDKTNRLLVEVGLSGYATRDVASLSGGEAQRVSIARTLANQPRVLLLDEPTSALDETAARLVEDLIVKINRERRMTCVIITHSPDQAERIAPRTMYMASARLVAIGPTRSILHAH